MCKRYATQMSSIDNALGSTLSFSWTKSVPRKCLNSFHSLSGLNSSLQTSVRHSLRSPPWSIPWWRCTMHKTRESEKRIFKQYTGSFLNWTLHVPLHCFGWKCFVFLKRVFTIDWWKYSLRLTHWRKANDTHLPLHWERDQGFAALVLFAAGYLPNSGVEILSFVLKRVGCLPCIQESINIAEVPRRDQQSVWHNLPSFWWMNVNIVPYKTSRSALRQVIFWREYIKNI